MRKKLYYLLTVLLIISGQNVKGESQINLLEINRFTSSFNHLNIELKITTSCQIPPIGFDHLGLSYSLLSAKNKDEIYFQKSSGFFAIDKKNCANGQIIEMSSISIPNENLFVGDTEYILLLTITGSKTQWSIESKPFNISEINKKIGKKLEKPVLKGGDFQVQPNKRDIAFMLNLKSNYDDTPKVRVMLYKDGMECSKIVEVLANQSKTKLLTPYSYLYLPPGNHTLTYKFFATAGNTLNHEIHSGSLSIVQPQLYWLSFESLNANINVEGMDVKSGFGQLFSNTAGQGEGDAFFEIRNKTDLLFISNEAKNSGKISDHKGKVQTYLNEPLKVIFYDKDVLSHDYLGEFDIHLKTEEQQFIKIRKQGKILNFDLIYTLTKVTKDNYTELKD